MMLQGGVYKLVDKDGNVDKKRVLKAKHRYALLAKVPLGLTFPKDLATVLCLSILLCPWCCKLYNWWYLQNSADTL